MIALFLTTTITCSDALKIIDRVTKTVGLTSQQRLEIIRTLHQSIPSCPLVIKSNESKRTPST